MQIQPYLFFDGRCEEAIAFYRATVGAEVQMLMRFKDAPEQPGSGQPGSEPGQDGQCMMPPGSGDKVMHACLRIGETQLLASDGQCGGKPAFQGFALSLTAETETEAERLFAALGEGGQVCMPMDRTFFASRFGMVMDRFGVSWMVLAMDQAPEKSAPGA